MFTKPLAGSSAYTKALCSLLTRIYFTLCCADRSSISLHFPGKHFFRMLKRVGIKLATAYTSAKTIVQRLCAGDMNYRDIFRVYKPMDERNSLTKGQFRVMRIIALIIFTMLVIISYTSSGNTVSGKGQHFQRPSGKLNTQWTPVALPAHYIN